MKPLNWNDLVPPGDDLTKHGLLSLGSLTLAVLVSGGRFHGSLTQALNIACIWQEDGQRVFPYGAEMPAFAQLLDGFFPPFWIPLLAALLLVWLNRSSFSHGSRALYLMKRLPDRWELPRRCLTIPLLTLLGSLLLALLLLPICWGAYCWVTPDHAMAPHQWAMVREALPRLLFPFL